MIIHTRARRRANARDRHSRVTTTRSRRTSSARRSTRRSRRTAAGRAISTTGAYADCPASSSPRPAHTGRAPSPYGKEVIYQKCVANCPALGAVLAQDPAYPADVQLRPLGEAIATNNGSSAIGGVPALRYSRVRRAALRQRRVGPIELHRPHRHQARTPRRVDQTQLPHVARLPGRVGRHVRAIRHSHSAARAGRVR